MSVKALKALYNQDKAPGCSHVERAILAFLAWRHDPDTGQCNPSIDTIAKGTALGRTAIAANLTKLEAKEYLTRQYTGYRRSTQYDLAFLERPAVAATRPNAPRERMHALLKRFAREYERVYKAAFKPAAEDWRHAKTLVGLYEDDDLLRAMVRNFFSMKMYTVRDATYAEHPMRTFYWLRADLVADARDDQRERTQRAKETPEEKAELQRLRERQAFYDSRRDQ